MGAVGARWRKVLAAESHAARHGWFGADSRAEVARVLARRHARWLGTGPVTVADRRLLFGGPSPRRTSLDTVERVVVTGAAVWVLRRHAHDWLIECASPADAGALADAFEAVE